MAFLPPPPAPPPPPPPKVPFHMIGPKPIVALGPAKTPIAKGIAKLGPITATPPAVSTILPIKGSPTLTPQQAITLIGKVSSDPPSQQFVIDTIGAGRAGNPEASANAQLLTLADAVNYSAGIVEKWFGKGQADVLRAMAHVGAPFTFTAGAAPAFLGR